MNIKKFFLFLFIFFIFTIFPSDVLSDNYVVYNQNELKEKILLAQDGDIVEINNPGTYQLPDIPYNITLKALCDDVNIDATTNLSICSAPNGVTFENLNLDFGQYSYHGFMHSGTIVMKDCTLNGLFFSYSKMEFYNCTFNQTSNEYCMWCYGDNIIYDTCTFNIKGKALNLYNEGHSEPCIIKFKNCSFISDVINKSAINIKETCEGVKLYYTVLIDNCTCNENFPTDKVGNNKLWMVDDLTSDGVSRCLVFQDGEKVYPFDTSDFEYDGLQIANTRPLIDDDIKDMEWANKICDALINTSVDLSSLAKSMSEDPAIIDENIKKKANTADVMIDLGVYYNKETKLSVDVRLKQNLCSFSVKNNKLDCFQIEIKPEYIINAYSLNDLSLSKALSDNYKIIDNYIPSKIKLYLPDTFVIDDNTNIYIKNDEIVYGIDYDIFPKKEGDMWLIEFDNPENLSKFDITTINPVEKEKEPVNPENPSHDDWQDNDHLYSIPQTGIK